MGTVTRRGWYLTHDGQFVGRPNMVPKGGDEVNLILPGP